MCEDCFDRNPKKRSRRLGFRSTKMGRGVYVDRSTRSNRVIMSSNSRNKGVRREDGVIISTTDTCTMLYHVPCLCGSFKHTRTNHKDCVLNPIYDDVIE